MRFLISFLIISLCACGQKPKINLQAKKLNDSAAHIAFRLGDYEKAITIIDKAIEIDSNYFEALRNKFWFHLHLDQFDKALELAKHLQRIKSGVPDYSETIGILYLKIGDSILANKYFAEAAIQYDNTLKTTSTESKNHTYLLISKAINLILLGKEQEGYDILKQLYEKEKDETYKEYIAQLMVKSRKGFIDDLLGRGGTQFSSPEISNDK